MDRRRFLLTSVAGALAAPLVVEAQPRAQVARIGVILTAMSAAPLDAFRQRLREFGYVEGQNIPRSTSPLLTLPGPHATVGGPQPRSARGE